MRIRLDKIASSTRNVGLFRDVTLGTSIPAQSGVVIAVRVLDDKSTYNHVEDEHGRMMRVQAGDVLAGVLGARDALRGHHAAPLERWCDGVAQQQPERELAEP